MHQKRKSFFLLVLVLAIFTVGAYFFSDDRKMVYEETEDETEAQSVSAVAMENDFFSDYRIHRDQRRDEAKELYKSVMLDPDRDEEAKQKAEASLQELYRVSSMEDRVEEILIGRDYRDVIFVMEETISLLILDQKSLEEKEKTDLIQFLSVYAGVPAENISVFTID